MPRVQVARLYACLVEGIGDEDYLLTTDADLIPLDPNHFSLQRNWNRSLSPPCPLASFFSDC